MKVLLVSCVSLDWQLCCVHWEHWCCAKHWPQSDTAQFLHSTPSSLTSNRRWVVTVWPGVTCVSRSCLNISWPSLSPLHSCHNNHLPHISWSPRATDPLLSKVTTIHSPCSSLPNYFLWRICGPQTHFTQPTPSSNYSFSRILFSVKPLQCWHISGLLSGKDSPNLLKSAIHQFG